MISLRLLTFAERRTRSLVLGCIAIGLLGASPCASAAAGPLDSSFGTNGISLTDRPFDGAASALARDSRGRLIVAGTTIFGDFSVVRDLPNGAPDLSFGDRGLVNTEVGGVAGARAIAVQGDGKIVVSGGSEQEFATTRYLPNGDPDRGFGKRGSVLTRAGFESAEALAMAIAPGGRILVAGYGISISGNWIAQLFAYRPNGAIDKSFGVGGAFKLAVRKGEKIAFSGARVLHDGKILISGDIDGRLLLIRLHPNGDLDRSFGGGDGHVVVDVDGIAGCGCAVANALTLAPHGKFVIVGSVFGRGPDRAMLASFLPSGKLDRGFGDGGVVKTRRGTRLVLNDGAAERDGTIVATGYYNSPRTGEAQVAVLRYLPNGELDPSFAKAGFFTRDLGLESVGSAVLVTPDGRAVVAGRANRHGPEFPELESALDNAEFMLMRFLP